MENDYIHEFAVLNGDANLDGVVAIGDFALLAASFGQSGRSFNQGDFTYDSIVNISDFAILAASFGKVLPPAEPARLTGRSSQFVKPTANSIARHRTGAAGIFNIDAVISSILL